MIDLSKTIDLSTTYLGLKLKNPLVASSSPMCQDVVNVRRMEEAGAAAVLKAMMAGAKVAMMTSALLKRGIGYLDTIATELLLWMGEHEYSSIKQMQGSMSRNSVPQPAAFERANYMKVLSSYAMR